jgi:large subunit ribosomal protein L21e
MKSEGVRRKTRTKLKKGPREKNKIMNMLKKFSKGDKVVVKIDSSVQGGMPDPKFHGRVGKVIDFTGRAYRIEIEDFGKKKILIVNPAHLKVVR